MKRYQNPWLWSSFAAILFSALFLFQNGTRAESTISLERKVSKDILRKVSEGRGGEFVRVIIQPTNSADLSIDSTLVYSGGENIRKFKNFGVRVVTLPVAAAVNLAARSDVSYVSLNRDVIPMGHLSSTTGTDQIRNTGPSGTKLDGTGVGIAILVWPEISAALLFHLMAITMVVGGLAGASLASRLRLGVRDRLLLGIAAGVSVVLGIVVLAWPGDAVNALRWFVAAQAFLVGPLLIVAALRAAGRFRMPSRASPTGAEATTEPRGGAP